MRFALLCVPLLVVACGKSKPATSSGSGGAPAGGTGGAGGSVTPTDGGGDGAAMVDRTGCPAAVATRPASTPTWSSISGLKNQQAFYTMDVASYVADNIIYYQNTNGGWPKNIDMSYRYGVDTQGVPRDTKSMIDNDATTVQIRYMAWMLGSWPNCALYANSFNNGMGFLFNAQYPDNGGWPQVWPIEPTDYSRHITYNDNAMVKVMQIMRDVAYGAALYKFVPAEMREKATASLNKGVLCMLTTQILVDGVKTGWCAQHDEKTLAPVKARAYELASESGKEGAQVAAFLMTLDLSRSDVPREDVINAVEAAVTFYDSIKILHTKYVQGASDAGASDSWIVEDPTAAPIWARFYDLEAPFKPFFCDRDGIKKYSLAEIGIERRGGYAWYVNDPSAILNTQYPAWVTRWSVGRNVLGNGPDGGASGDAGTASDGMPADGTTGTSDASDGGGSDGGAQD